MIQENSEAVESPAVDLAATGTPFVVGFYFSFRTFVMLLSVRILGVEPQSGTAIMLLLDYLLLLWVAFQYAGTAGTTSSAVMRLSSVRWVLLFIVFSGCSLFWSVAASLPAAAAYWCAMTADVAIVLLLLRSAPVEEAAHALMKGYVWGACLVALLAWLMPAQSDLRLGDEELLGANQIGYLCGFAFFFAQYLVQRNAGKYGPAATLLGLTLLRSLSKTTIVAFAVAEAFLLLRDRSMGRRIKLWLLTATALVCLVFSGLLMSYFNVYSNAGNSPETLTGRLTIWAVIFAEAIRQPWFGHGFYSVWKVIPPFGTFEARHAHNELLQQFYLFGATGLVMMAGLYGSFYRLTRRFAFGPLRTFFSALMIFILIRGLADTEVYDFSLPLWAIVLFSLLLQELSPMAASSTEASPRAGHASGLKMR